ncbi:MAG: hypothetical protein JNM94_09325 [Phycisphaerae bacterium]|nr:hypothetical protein [Phycisphaerae bacterium]
MESESQPRINGRTGTAVTCPKCGGAMEDGRAYVAGTGAGFLAVGLSWQHLWFESASGKRPIVRSSTLSSHIVPAHACPSCGAVLLEAGGAGGR